MGQAGPDRQSPGKAPGAEEVSSEARLCSLLPPSGWGGKGKGISEGARPGAWGWPPDGQRGPGQSSQVDPGLKLTLQISD